MPVATEERHRLDGAAETDEYVVFEDRRLVFLKEPPFEVLEAILKKLKKVQESLPFWIGDAINRGWLRYGDDFFQALGKSDKTLQNWASACAGIDPSRRREDVGWSQHYEVASLPPEKQVEVLARVAEENLSSHDTRDLVGAVKDEIAAADLAAGRKPRYVQRVQSRKCRACGGTGCCAQCDGLGEVADVE